MASLPTVSAVEAPDSSATTAFPLLEKVCQKIKEDDSFHLETEGAKRCLLSAEKFLSALKADKNVSMFHVFSEWLLSKLGSFVDRALTDQIGMWSRFHQFRSSTEFKQKWTYLLVSAGVPEDPLFYQNITLQVFEGLIKDRFPVDDDDVDSEVITLSYEEENAIRYVGGYILKSLQKELRKDEDMLVTLKELIDDDCSTEAAQSEEWIALVDRGGLTYIKDCTHTFLCSVEYCLRQYLRVNIAHKLDQNFRSKVVSLITENDDVQFNWLAVAAEITSEDISDEIMVKIIEKWIIVRGFSFANSIMEMYKSEAKKGTQKSKGLRHTLAAKENDK